MPITYTNRKDTIYILCQGTKKSGKPHYYFSQNPKGVLLDIIPEGYEIRENINGQVSLGKLRVQHIRPEELAVVQQKIALLPKGRTIASGLKYSTSQIFFSQSPIRYNHVREKQIFFDPTPGAFTVCLLLF